MVFINVLSKQSACRYVRLYSRRSARLSCSVKHDKSPWIGTNKYENKIEMMRLNVSEAQHKQLPTCAVLQT